VVGARKILQDDACLVDSSELSHDRPLSNLIDDGQAQVHNRFHFSPALG
jgi:hypothetical protein